MITYELYINGILCDLAKDEVVTLRYQSPLFAELDNIQSNRSYNIALPPSPVNLNAIGQAQRPDVDSEVPYIRLPASLYQDGIPLFTNGFAIVTDISETINVTLTWGNVDNFQPLFDENLRDLGPTWAEHWPTHIDWDENTTILGKDPLNTYPDVGFWGINFGWGLSDPKYLHPCVKASAIVSAIERRHGITFDNKNSFATDALGPLIPLVSKNGDYKSGEAEVTICEGGNKPYKLSNKETFSVICPISVNRPELFDPNTGRYDCKGGEDTVMTLTSFYFSANWHTPPTFENTRIQIIDADDPTHVLSTLTPIAILGSGDTARMQVRFTEIGGSAMIVAHTKDIESINIIITNQANADHTANGSIQLYTRPRDEVHFPSIFPVVANLPDMSQGDFIHALMSMNGLFAYADKDNPNTIKLISIDDIFYNAEAHNIVDWSDRVILNDFHRIDMPDASSFTIDDFAQRNVLDYDNDDDVQTETYGVISVRNTNIEKETELVSLPFSASENKPSTGGMNCALVPIYEGDSDGSINYSECSPRILWGHLDSTLGPTLCVGLFTSWMKFGGDEGIVNRKYSSYQKAIDRLRIVSLRIKMSALDLYNLDYRKPVYISQFGQLFAIYSVETGEDGICDCQLLKLNDINTQQ